MKPFRNCQYSAFISYAHADDEAWMGWVSAFKDVLERTLKARVGRSIGVQMPTMHLSGRDGPVGGSLSSELKARIADSWAMIIVVHDNYVQSDWCLKELEYFKSLFGDQGFLERLYVVAMSQSAIAAVTAKPEWKALLPIDDLLWIPFFKEDEPDEPARVRLDQGQPSQRFQDQLEGLRADLERKIKQECERPPSPSPALSPVAASAGARAQAPAAAMPLGQGALLFGVPAPELAEATQALADALARLGVRVERLAADTLSGDFPGFDTAAALVLPFGTGGSALKPFAFTPGGHLAAQRDAWLGHGRPAEGLIWLDLRHLPCAAPAGRGHAELIAEIGAQALTPDALRARLAPPPLPASERVNIYIESNRNEVSLWEPLGEQLKRKWDQIVQAQSPTLTPRLSVRARGLPVDQIDDYPPLDDADGVVLLWGRKEPKALMAQINKVERKLTGADVPPSMVAYLMPPQPDPDGPVPAWSWRVLRFEHAGSDAIDVVRDEADELQAFLCKVLKHTTTKRRRLLEAAAEAAR